MNDILEKEMNKCGMTHYSELFESGWEFLNNPKKGYQTPWSVVGDAFNFIPGELTLLSGYTGQGKSLIVTQMAIHAISQGAKAMIASLEMSAGQVHARIARQSTGAIDPTREYYKKINDFYCDNMRIFDTRGVADLKKVLEGCRMTAQIEGTNFFVFDNLMMLDSKADDYNKQLDNVQKMVEFTKTFNVCVILVAHSKKPSEYQVSRGGSIKVPGIYDVMGASGVANLVDNHLSISRNSRKKNALDVLKAGGNLTPDEQQYLNQGDTILARDKKREHGDYFLKFLYYDERFRCLKDYENKHCINYIDR